MMPAWCCSPFLLAISRPLRTSSLFLIGSSGAKIGLKIGAVSVPVGRNLFTPF
jgi:hypothetical protein